MKLFAWCDAPTAPTGFGRSAKHVLHALHQAGWDIVQLAVNFDAATQSRIPWKVYAPSTKQGDPYGLADLPRILATEQPDVLWSTFDPEVPWRYAVPGTTPAINALDLLRSLRPMRPGFRMVGWFPVDGGPLSDMELAVLGLGEGLFDASVTMSPHVRDLAAWTIELKHAVRGAKQRADRDLLAKRIRVIPHGVELDSLRIASEEERREAKRTLGLDPDAFCILQMERNQQRKQNYLGLAVLEILLSQKLERRVQLYQHMHPDEENTGCMVGFNLPELSWRYGLRAGQDVFWPQGGFVSEEELLLRYAAADAFLSTSTGEGFQYPAWEALAAGVPIVVPNDSARAAYFTHAPNAHLYDVLDKRMVMRGGYARRMSYPQPEAAATILRKMVNGRHKYSPKAEAGRAFVAKTANVRDVQAAWVQLMEEQRQGLIQERKAQSIALPGSASQVDVHVTMLQNPGLGDVCMLGPGLRALRAQGKRVRLEVQRSHLDLARLIDLADEYLPAMHPHGGTAEELRQQAGQLVRIEALHHPLPHPAWHATHVPRFLLMADAMGLRGAELEPFAAAIPEEVRKRSHALFLDTFQVAPENCVGIALQSSDPKRSLPDAYARQLAAHVKQMGLVPVFLGSRTLGIRELGTIDLTGQTDVVAVMGLLANLVAVVSTDSATLHMALAIGCPAVGAFTLYPPESRLCYATRCVAVVPPNRELEGERFPAGNFSKHTEAWSASITPRMLAQGLFTLLDRKAQEPVLVGA